MQALLSSPGWTQSALLIGTLSAAKLQALQSSDVYFSKMLRQLTTATMGLGAYLRADGSDASLLADALDSLDDLNKALARLTEFQLIDDDESDGGA